MLDHKPLTVTIPCRDLIIGDYARLAGDTGQFRRLRSIFRETPDCLVLTFEGLDGEVYAMDKLFQIIPR